MNIHTHAYINSEAGSCKWHKYRAYKYIHVHLHTRVPSHTHTNICIYTYTHQHVQCITYISIHAHIGMRGLTFGTSIVRTNIPTSIYTHTCTYTHLYIYTYTHIHTNTHKRTIRNVCTHTYINGGAGSLRWRNYRAHEYVSTQLHIHICIHTCVYVRTYIHI